MASAERLRQRRRERRHRIEFISRIQRQLLKVGNEIRDRKWQGNKVFWSLLVLVLTIGWSLHPVNHNRYIAKVADNYVGVQLEDTGEQLLGFRQTSETGEKGFFFHGDLLICVESQVYRFAVVNEPRIPTIVGVPIDEDVTVTADRSFLSAKTSIWPCEEPGNREHDHDVKTITIDFGGRPIWRHRGLINVAIC